MKTISIVLSVIIVIGVLPACFVTFEIVTINENSLKSHITLFWIVLFLNIINLEFSMSKAKQFYNWFNSNLKNESTSVNL